jgi:polysaccharide biosynthesis transport protein
MLVESSQKADPGCPAEPEVDLGGVWKAIVAHRKWIIGPTLFALAASTAFVNIVKPRYTAETRVLLEMQDSFMPRGDKNPEIAGPGPQLDAEAVGSQIQLVTSRDVARRAIKQIPLLGNPEFDPLANGMGAITRLLVLAGLKRDPTQLSPEDRVLESYYEKLTVFSPTKTRVVNIEFQSNDPDLSAKAANTIADIYLDYQQEAKREIARAAAGSLANLVGDLKTRVAAASAKAEEFRAQSGLLVGTNNTTVNAQQLGEVNTELSRARTAQADAQAKARLIREMIKQGRVSEIPDVANNELVRRISEQRVGIKAQLALESRTLLPGHPRIKELNAQLADLDAELRTAGEKVARTLENDARIAGSRVENLQATLEQQKQIVGSSSADEVKMRELDRTARQLREELEAATTKYQEALARESSKSTPADARVISKALAPQIPSFPKKLPIIGFSTVAAFVLSTAIVVSRQLSAERPARRTPAAPLPVEALAVAAKVEEDLLETADAPASPGDAPAQPIIETADPALVQQARMLAQEIVGKAEVGATLAVIACDADDDQGFALSVARVLSREGRTILVALDDVARMPATAQTGLGDLIFGTASFHETIHRDSDTRLHLLGAGERQAIDADGLWSALNALMEAYDFVVVAASRNIDVDEAATLAHLASACAVYSANPDTAAVLADALERGGLPLPSVIGLAKTEAQDVANAA